MNETELYLAWVGQQALQQQLADQQQQAPAETQEQRTWRILNEQRLQAQRRTIEAARQREQAFLAQRDVQREQEHKEMAELQEVAWKREAIEEWSGANLPLSDFDKSWPTILKAKQQAALEQQAARLKQLPASSAF